MAIPRREVAQTLASTFSKRGLNRKVRATLLRVRTRRECPDGNLRELMWESNTNRGIDREREREEKERDRERKNFCTKSPNLRYCWARSQNKDWANTRGKLAGCEPAYPQLETGRQAGGSQSRKGANSAPEMGFSTKLQAGSQLPTKSSWDPGQMTSSGSVAARSAPQKRHMAHLSQYTHKTKQLGQGRG